MKLPPMNPHEVILAHKSSIAIDVLIDAVAVDTAARCRGQSPPMMAYIIKGALEHAIAKVIAASLP